MNGAQYRKKPVVVEASEWRKNGDHPADNASEMFDYPDGCQRPRVIREGLVVRYFRHPDVGGETACKHCGVRMHEHGWIDTLEGGHIVCPGDFVITGVKGEHYPCKPDIFAATYAPVSAENANYAGITFDDLRAVESEVYATESVEQIGLMPFAKALLALVARRLETP